MSAFHESLEREARDIREAYSRVVAGLEAKIKEKDQKIEELTELLQRERDRADKLERRNRFDLVPKESAK